MKYFVSGPCWAAVTLVGQNELVGQSLYLGPCCLIAPGEFWHAEGDELVKEFAAKGDFRLLIVEMAILEGVAESPFQARKGGFD